MRVGKLALSIALSSAVAISIFALVGNTGSSFSLRGSTKLGLVKTIAYVSKTVNTRRLDTTEVSCDKVQAVFEDGLMGCIYGNTHENETENNSCFTRALISEGLYPANSVLLNVIEANDDALNAKHVSFPRELAAQLTHGVVDICRNGTAKMHDTALVKGDPGQFGLTQAEFDQLVMDYVNDQVLPTCDESDLSTERCELAMAAIVVLLDTADLGDSTGDFAAVAE